MKCSFYLLLLILNLGVFILNIVAYDNATQYINDFTLFLSSVMAIVIHFMLKDSQKNKNPLLALMSFLLIVFFQFRVFSLGYTEYSIVLSRSNSNHVDINYSFFYILCATLIIWYALHFSLPKLEKIKLNCPDKINSSSMLKLVYVSMFLLVIPYLNIPGISSLVSILQSLFFKTPVLLMIAFAFFLKHRDNRSQLIYFIISVFLFFILQTLAGSRSGILTLFYVFVPSLFIQGKVFIKVKHILIGIFLLPVSIFLFTFSTYMRQMDMQKSSIVEKITFVSEAAELQRDLDLKTTLSPVFDRIGFFDYAVETIKQKDAFAAFLNPIFCIKSIVDNVLTPGFDVFGIPKSSNAMRLYYNNLPLLKSSLKMQEYQSDEFTIFGESYVMFYGWFSLIPIFFIFKLFKKMYVIYLKRGNYIKMAFIVYLFIILFNSFGIDWFIFDLVSVLLTYYIFKLICYRHIVSSEILKK